MNEKVHLLRNYQKEIVARVLQEWKQVRSVMVQMPTGTGKTHVLASIVERFSGKTLVVAHRVELVEQIRKTVRRFHHSSLKTQNSKLNISSIQTISRRLDKLDFVPELIIIDEAHHALAQTYRILWEKWPEAKFLGLTATPYRMSEDGFTDLFDKLVTSWSIEKFIQQGILSEFESISLPTDSPEQRLIDSLKKRGADGDYQTKEMDAVLNQPPCIEQLYRSIRTYAKGKKGIVYAISIDHAKKITEFYSQQGILTAEIHSRTPRAERNRLVEAFKAGDIQVLVNVDVFSEGFDCPDVEFIQLARPTLSLAKYLQQVGRGLRRSEGKEQCLLIDNVGLFRTFGPPTQPWDWEGMFQGKLKAWQDPRTGLWGLKRGRETIMEAQFRSIQWARNHFLMIGHKDGQESYLDLSNFQHYSYPPEIKRYGNFELLKINHTCYSRTLKRYESGVNWEAMVITLRGFYLFLYEGPGKSYALLENDTETFYRILHWMEDGSIVVSDTEGKLYRASKAGKVYLGEAGEYKTLIAELDKEIRQERETNEENKKRKIQEDYHRAVPYQSGMKWGLKVGERITVPPIYRHIQKPVGKYCAVEKNYSQWGIISIDGTVLVEPKYPEVSIESNGTALLTQVTGKKTTIHLK